MRMRKVVLRGSCEELEATEYAQRICVNKLACDGLWDRKVRKGKIPKHIPLESVWGYGYSKGPSCSVPLAVLVLEIHQH